MILQRLKELNHRIQEKINPPYHKKQHVRWILEISDDGKFSGFIETGVRKRDWTIFVAPYSRRAGSSPPPYLFVDKPTYVLGVSLEGVNEEKTKQLHQKYIQLASDCAESTDDPKLKTFVQFLETGMDAIRDQPEITEMKASDLIAPRVGGTILTDLRSVQQYWQALTEKIVSDSSRLQTVCLLCGNEKPIAKTHPIELVVIVSAL